MNIKDEIHRAAEIIASAKHVTAFTGAGISVESGIPPFRGKQGIWNTVDPQILDITFFQQHPEVSWPLIKEIFFNRFRDAEPNTAHIALAALEQQGIIKAIITQNIDGLHQRAGSKHVLEFHGNSHQLVCLQCRETVCVTDKILSNVPPRCPRCNAVLKPDFVFFGESIPELAASRSYKEAKDANVFLLVGTTGLIQPASLVPMDAKSYGATIIEINTEHSSYTRSITDIFLQGRSTEIMKELHHELSMK